jgi:hypothetical protein
MRENDVAIKKNVTEKVVAANRSNARKSTGPRETERTRLNALTHGLLAKHLIFQDEGARTEFNALLHEIETDYRPSGRLEQLLVEEITICVWKAQALNGLEQREMEDRRKASKAILRAVAENCDDKPLPLFVNDDGSRSDAQFSWECRELIVRTGTNSSEREGMPGGDDLNSKSGSAQIEARLNTSGDTLLRYSAAVKKDLYRAITTLRETQRDRREHSD